jgi:phage FluMu protein Com
MQIRCSNCHKPFALSAAVVEAALEQINSEHLGHFDAQCPHCRRVNRVSPKELQRSLPMNTGKKETTKGSE